MSRRAFATSGQPLNIALIATLVVWTVGVSAVLATGRASLPDAIFLVAGPWAALAAVFRPEWLLLGLIALPAGVTDYVQTSRMVVLVLLALIAVALTRPTFSLASGTGIIALTAIAAAGYAFQADVNATAQDANQTLMLVIVYCVLLAVLAFNLTMLGDLRAQH